MSDFSAQNAVCYSGYRLGQDPRQGIFPSYEQVKQDLKILAQHWSLLRLYDCSHHAQLVLNVIRNENLPLKVMLGADLGAEVSNPNCPWGAHYSDKVLTANRLRNQQQIRQMIDYANAFPEWVFAVSIGNEASVDWNDHMVPVESLIEYAQQVRKAIEHPVTFCENYVPWTDKLIPLVPHLDFISIHTYPAWEYKDISEAIAFTEQNYRQVADVFPDKPIVITEAGWATKSNGQGIDKQQGNCVNQAQYCHDLVTWSRKNEVLSFVFEAFDEPWKGSDDPFEPEKHWGLFYEDRTPKPVVETLLGAPRAIASGGS
ncbi:hypothetical protein GCM10009114_28770 [Aliiglaciecola litoralis]|uniref:Endo-1,3-beta-glucanase btgC n=2 Tax=Aliiglaciecola litoralis TaxID=582857 RepID=A0ABN1LPL8_9ALTE